MNNFEQSDVLLFVLSKALKRETSHWPKAEIGVCFWLFGLVLICFASLLSVFNLGRVVSTCQ